MQSQTKPQSTNGGNLGFEEKLWKTADKLRSNMDAADYKHVVLGLIFIKYVSDSFQEKHKQLESQLSRQVVMNLHIMNDVLLFAY